jgi:hypothetical protein
MPEKDLKTASNETEGKKPILHDELDLTKRTMLANLILQPGWQVVIELAEAVCKEATNKVIKLDVEAPDYSKKLAALQQMAQSTNRFCARLFSSIDFHANLAKFEHEQQDDAAQKAALLAEISEQRQ